MFRLTLAIQSIPAQHHPGEPCMAGEGWEIEGGGNWAVGGSVFSHPNTKLELDANLRKLKLFLTWNPKKSTRNF